MSLKCKFNVVLYFAKGKENNGRRNGLLALILRIRKVPGLEGPDIHFHG